MYASLENHAHGEKRPCVCHPDFLYIYFVDTTLAPNEKPETTRRELNESATGKPRPENVKPIE